MPYINFYVSCSHVYYIKDRPSDIYPGDKVEKTVVEHEKLPVQKLNQKHELFFRIYGSYRSFPDFRKILKGLFFLVLGLIDVF